MSADIARVPRQLVNRGIADADQSGTTFCPASIEFKQLVGYHVILAHVHVHGRHDNSIRYLQTADMHRLKQQIFHFILLHRP